MIIRKENSDTTCPPFTPPALGKLMRWGFSTSQVQYLHGNASFSPRRSLKQLTQDLKWHPTMQWGVTALPSTIKENMPTDTFSDNLICELSRMKSLLKTPNQGSSFLLHPHSIKTWFSCNLLLRRYTIRLYISISSHLIHSVIIQLSWKLIHTHTHTPLLPLSPSLHRDQSPEGINFGCPFIALIQICKFWGLPLWSSG